MIMPSKQQDEGKMSPVLFMTVDGEPMCFFLRPGPIKRKLQPLITAGGGILCNVQKPGVILLIDPDERASIPESTAHWYVSTQYIHDCIEKDEQLTLEDYRLNPNVDQTNTTKLKNGKENCATSFGGRVAYTCEDDAAILSYVSKRETEIGGNKLWQEMEKRRVTCHSWQSMKYHFRLRLTQKLSEVEEKTAEAETKVEQNQRTEAKSLSSEDAPASAQADSPGTGPVLTDSAEYLTQKIDVQGIPDQDIQPEDAEADTSNNPKPQDPVLEPATYSEPIPTESSESDEPQPPILPETGNVLEDSPPAQTNPVLELPLQNISCKKQNASPKLAKPQLLLCRVTRRQLEVESQPYSKRLRSSSTPNKDSSQHTSKMKLSAKSALQKETTAEPPLKRARGKGRVEEMENEQEESEQNTASKKAQQGSSSVPQKGEKTMEKRKLGILELATKEFEDESEGDDDDSPGLQNKVETPATQSMSTESPVSTSHSAADGPLSKSNQNHVDSSEKNAQEAQTCTDSHVIDSATVCPEPVGSQSASSEPQRSEPALAEPQESEHAGCQAAASKPQSCEPTALEPAVSERFLSEDNQTCKAHFFIFDSESQEEDSQSLFGDNTSVPTAPQSRVNKDSAHSLTQAQLEADKQQIRDLMKQTNQDLESVTKALLKTSGDWAAALDLLMDPSSFSGPFWTLADDGLLLSADPHERQRLQEKYGEDGVAKRLIFHEIERQN